MCADHAESFFDVFFEVPLSALPPQPEKLVPGPNKAAALAGETPSSVPCPPDTNWRATWTSSGREAGRPGR